MILRDPVHGLIAFDTDDDQIVERLLSTPEVQRLRRIRQLGLTSLAYPGAEHSRFAHAIGTAHIMKRLLERLSDVEEWIAPEHRLTPEARCEALASALLHDLGHGPLSHLFEEVLPSSAPHEEWTQRIVQDSGSGVNRVLTATGREIPERVAELIGGKHPLTYLARAVSGTLDVDRCDYLLRDAHATGVPYGRYDLDWLLRSLRFAPATTATSIPPLAIDAGKGIASLESFILARLFMFQQVYFHKTTRAAEWMVRALFARVVGQLRDGTPLAGVPAAIDAAARGRPVALGDYLELDDSVLWGALHIWESSRDPVLADLSARMRSRALFKTREITDQDEPSRTRALEIAREEAKRSGLDPESYVDLDVAVDVPFDDREDPLTVVLPRGVVRKPGDVSFLLGRLRGESLVRARLIFPSELRERIDRALDS
jgi:HD superfamily phosphohydrolase